MSRWWIIIQNISASQLFLKSKKKVDFKFSSRSYEDEIDGVERKVTVYIAGKEILTKAVAQAIPTFIMSCFALLSSFYDELQSLVSHY